MDKETNDRLRVLDRRLQQIYREAYEDAVKNHEKALEKLAAFNSGEFADATKDELRRAARNYQAQVERTEGIVRGISRDIANSGRIAERAIHGESLNIFEIGYSNSLRSLDGQLGFGVAWDVYDRNQLTAILDNKPLMIKKEVLLHENGELVKREIEVSAQSFGQVGAREKYVGWEFKTDKDGNRIINAKTGKPVRKSIYVRERAFGRLADDGIIARRLQHELTKSIILGEGIPKIATRIKAVTEVSRRQAVMIARTETLRAANQGRMLGFQQARDDYGIEMRKKWIATYDKRTRDQHMEVNNDEVELDEKFRNGLLYPLDPSGPAEEVINCRCVTVAVLKALDDDKREALKDAVGVKENAAQKGEEILDKSAKSDIIDSRDLRDDEDFFYDILGSAIENNKADVDEIWDYVNEKGGKVILLDNGNMYYNPGSPGMPGEIKIDRNASIGSWKHEFRHFLDEEADGFPGARIYGDVDKHWQRERNAYMEEYNLARDLGRQDIMDKILKQMEMRKGELYGG